tara:strand:+ start:5958 stop:6299 length:342 start_codon:yes stop_codon:yes gene_type:complete
MPGIKEVGLFLVILVAGELVTNLFFFILIKIMNRGRMSFSGAIRGTFERLFLFFAMVNDIFHALTLFGALKIATHIKDDDRVSNDYFLIGNLISVSAAIGYFILYNILWFEFF